MWMNWVESACTGVKVLVDVGLCFEMGVRA